MKNYFYYSLFSLLFIISSCNEESVKSHTLSSSDDIDISYAVAQTKTLWNKGKDREETVVLNVLLINGSDLHKELVQEYASIWSQYANIDFRFTSDPDAVENFDISVDIFTEDLKNNIAGLSHVGSNSRSYARKDKGSMSLWILERNSRAAIKGLILHEFGHALGLRHEHQHPERSFNYIEEKLFDNCQKSNWSESQCRSFKLNTINQEGATIFEYDSNSIMHYGLHKDIIENYEENALRIAKSLSLIDKTSIAKLYPGRKTYQEIIEDHTRIMEEIEAMTEYKDCIIVDYLNLTNGRTFYYYKEKNKVYPPQQIFPLEDYKQDTIVNMQADERCLSFTEVFDDFLKDL